MSRNRKKRLGLSLFAVLVVSGILFSLWPQTRELKHYTVPIVIRDEIGRDHNEAIQILAHPDYVVDKPRYTMVGGNGAAPPGYNDPPYFMQSIALHSRRHSQWIPGWLNRLFGGNLHNSPSSVEIREAPSGSFRHQPASIVTDFDPDRNLWTASRKVTLDRDYSVFYSCHNETVFEATYRQICDSFKVIK